MNVPGALFAAIAALLVLVLPVRLAIVPVLLTFAWTTDGEVLDLGGLHFTALRLVVGVGLLRTVLRAERPGTAFNRIDAWMLAWAACFLVTAPFHASSGVVYRLGQLWDILGVYHLARVFLRTPQDVLRSFGVLCVALVPVALAMLAEKQSGRNAFAVLGGVNAVSAVREGSIRANGPFAHPILAGTVGAALIPMALALRAAHPWQAVAGLASGAGIVIACASSSPLLMLGFTLFGLALYRVREHLGAVRWAALAGILALAAVMKDPVYFLMARIDLAGGSTGWFRAQLIRSSLQHLDEWWLVGTEFTRHWMPTGNPANEGQTDITNFYLQMGVWGGLVLLGCFVGLLTAAFGEVGRALRRDGLPEADRLLAWTLGSALFGHVMNFLSISLFDKTKLCLLLLLAGIATVAQGAGAAARAPAPAAPRRPAPPARGPEGLALPPLARRK